MRNQTIPNAPDGPLVQLNKQLVKDSSVQEFQTIETQTLDGTSLPEKKVSPKSKALTTPGHRALGSIQSSILMRKASSQLPDSKGIVGNWNAKSYLELGK